MDNENKNLTELELVRSEIKAQKAEYKELAGVLTSDDVTEEQIKRSDDLCGSLERLELKEKALCRAEHAKSYFQASKESKASKVFGSPAVKIARKATHKDADNALKAWVMQGHKRSHIPDSWKRSADLVESDWESKEFFCRAQSTDVEGEGQELLNGSILQELVEAKQWEGSILEYCDIINDPITAAEQPIHFSTNDDTDVFGAYKAQNAALTNVGTTYDKVVLNTHMVTTAMFPLSISYIMNPNTRIMNHVNGILGRRLRRTILRDITVGDGSGKPRGFLADVEVGAAGYSNWLSPEDFQELWYELDEEYLRNAVFLGNKATAKSMESTLKNWETGEREWGTDLNSPPTDTLRGKRFITSRFMPTMTPGTPKLPIVFGDFSYHKVRFVGTPQLIRDESRLIDSLSVFCAAYQLVDSAYVNPGNNPLLAIQTGALSGDSSYTGPV